MENDQTGNEAKAGERLPRHQRALQGELEGGFLSSSDLPATQETPSVVTT